MVEKWSNQPLISRRNQQSKLWFLVDYQRFMFFATGCKRLSTGGLFPDAMIPEDILQDRFGVDEVGAEDLIERGDGAAEVFGDEVGGDA